MTGRNFSEEINKFRYEYIFSPFTKVVSYIFAIFAVLFTCLLVWEILTDGAFSLRLGDYVAILFFWFIPTYFLSICPDISIKNGSFRVSTILRSSEWILPNHVKSVKSRDVKFSPAIKEQIFVEVDRDSLPFIYRLAGLRARSKHAGFVIYSSIDGYRELKEYFEEAVER